MVDRLLGLWAGLLVGLFPPGFRRAVGTDLRRLLVDAANEARRTRGRNLCMYVAWNTAISTRDAALEWAELVRARTPGRRGETMGGIGGDVRYALRRLRRAPGFALVSTGTLALGVGPVAGILALVDGILLRPLPYAEPDRLVRVWDSSTRVEGWDRVNVNPANFRDWQERASSFDRLVGFVPEELTLTTNGVAERVQAAWVTAGVFDAVGVPPALGREPTAIEDTPGSAAAVTVLSHEAWTSRFGTAEDVIGRSVVLEGRAFEVIGVAPEGFRLPGVQTSVPPLFYVPGGFGDPNGRGGHWLLAVGRLAPGVGVARAQEEMDVISAALEEEYPGPNRGLRAVLEPLHEAEVGASRSALGLFLGAVALLLALSCVNLAGLFLVRGFGRAREFGVRAALGAGRGRIFRQLTIEALLLGVLGGTIGTGLAWVLVEILSTSSGLRLPRLEDVTVHPGIVLATLGLALLSAAVSALVPASLALSGPPVHPLRGRPDTLGGANRPVAALATLEVALSALLVTGAGLLARSYLELSAVDPGFRAEGAAVVRIVVPESTYDDAARADLYRRLLERVASLPGVRAAGAGDSPPLQRAQNSRTAYRPDDRPEPGPDESPLVAWEEFATEGYFEALGIPLLEGRTFRFTDDADAPPVAVVDAAFAEATWPGRSAVGETFSYNGRSWEIVGVVGSARRRTLESESGPEMFFPPAQHPWWVPSAVFVTVRTDGDPASIVPAVRRVVTEIAPDVPVGLTATMESLVAETLAPRRLQWLLVSTFATFALLVATLGVYGVLMHVVEGRRHEVGVRMALGAGRASVQRMVFRRGLLLTLGGTAAGLIGAVALGRSLASFLYGVRPLDPSTLSAVVILVTTAGAVASWLPARRASSVDPVRILNEEAG